MSGLQNARYLPRKIPRQRRSKATVEAILEAAARVLVDTGYDGATTNVIANRAGVGVGSVYEYFPGKEAIFAALMHQVNTQMFESMMAQIGDFQGLSAEMVLHRVVDARVRSVRERVQLYAALRDEIPHHVTAHQTDNMLDTFRSVSLAFLETHKSLVRPRHADLISDVAMRTMYAIVEDLAIHAPEKLDDQEYLDELRFLISRYVLSD